MVSPLWTAAAENDVENLRRLLADASVADVEITDGSGATPLIQAARAGHVDAVRALLDRGADPHHACAEGRPDQLASDPAVLQLLHGALQARGPPPPPEGMPYWAPPPPPGMYGYYDGGAGAFFPPPFALGPGNMPPPDIARLIPCRFFPACRYGAGCLFAHPPAAGGPPPPFYQGAAAPPPPAPYGHYDPAQAYGAPGYYPPPPLSPTAYHPGGMPPPPPPVHAPTSPVHGGPLSPVQASYPPAPGVYPPPMVPGFPPQGMVPPPGAPMYAPVPPPVFAPPPPGPQQQPGGPGSPPGPQQQQHPMNGPGHNRRGSTRRPPSFASSRKPPCIFFPSGRCKNGDECRFPHVLPDGGPTSVRGPLRPRFAGANGNGFAGIEEKMAGMALDGRGLRGPPGPQAARPRVSPPLKQRLPGADEFPTLNGSAPPSRGSPPASATALTAAQVLQAPAPVRESKPASVNGSAGSPSGSVNGDVSSASEPDTKPEVVAAPPQPLPKVAVKLPLSFAAAANSAVATTPELSVSA